MLLLPPLLLPSLRLRLTLLLLVQPIPRKTLNSNPRNPLPLRNQLQLKPKRHSLRNSPRARYGAVTLRRAEAFVFTCFFIQSCNFTQFQHISRNFMGKNMVGYGTGVMRLTRTHGSMTGRRGWVAFLLLLLLLFFGNIVMRLR